MEHRRLPWWQLVVMGLIAGGLAVLEQINPLHGASPDFVGVVIALVTFGAILVWIHENGGLLQHPSTLETGASPDFESDRVGSVPSEPGDRYAVEDSAPPFGQAWSPPLSISRPSPEHARK